jgi:hypothetical protein
MKIKWSAREVIASDLLKAPERPELTFDVSRNVINPVNWVPFTCLDGGVQFYVPVWH